MLSVILVLSTGVYYGCLLLLFAARCTTNEDIQFVPLSREFLALLDDEKQYNKYATPTQYDGVATNVSMSMYIEGISSFSAQTMDYQLDMYFYQEWYDPRIAHNGTGPILIRDKKVFGKLWRPDLYFANARSASFQEITEDNFLVWVYPDGKVWYDCRKYPLDSQTCELRILSYAYPESQLRLRWSHTIDPPIDRNKEIRMPDMRLVDIKTGTCNGTYATGTWSCMTAVFLVQREMMHHIIQTYVPTALIVVISWFNFWLDIDSAPARVSLSITTLLTIATQANAVKLALPEVSYMKAIDFWLGMCMAFVFGVMIEFTICHFAKNQEMHRSNGPRNLVVDSTFSTLFGSTVGAQEKEEMNGTEDFERSMLNNHHHNNNSAEARLRIPPEINPDLGRFEYGGERVNLEPQKSMKPAVSKLRKQVSKRALTFKSSICNLRGREIATKIDEKSRFVFPFVFVIFNVFYWSFYLVFN
ncbi:Protein LGC-40 [Aphelenchoides avenae]|nr:Protein LGC-40 [Aphelenchus avenae]